MEYKVIMKDSYLKFLNEMNENLKLGWVPQGGVMCYIGKDNNNYFVQAVIRHKKTVGDRK